MDGGSTITALRDSLASSWDRHLSELRRLVEVPSVSAHGRGLHDAAAVVASLLEARDLRTVVHEAPGAPVVVAHGGAEDGPTLLFYEHYDVQPAKPLDEWTVPPFELTERDGCLYGRGAADTKGHIVCRLAAVDAVRDVLGVDPVRYVFVIEGAEEIGSPGLPEFLAAHAGELRADACLWESGGVDADGHPVVYAGMKGVVGFELRCRVASQDLHSSLGAVVDNPLYRLAAAIATLRDADGRATIDGFLDDVEPPAPADEAAMLAHPDDSSAVRDLYGLRAFLPAAAGAYQRRMQLEPCVNVNGIHGGYGGPGMKTVLPREGVAKLDIRLVPRQDPARTVELVRVHLDRRGFTDVEIVVHDGEAAARTPLDHPFVRLVASTAELAYGRPVVLKASSAGSGPVHAFAHHLGVPFAGAGCAYPGSRAHAPDEHVRLGDLATARLHSALVLAALGGQLG